MTKNRKGIVEKFPIVTLSIPCICYKTQVFNDTNKISESISKIKKTCKQIKSSCFIIE